MRYEVGIAGRTLRVFQQLSDQPSVKQCVAPQRRYIPR